MPLCAIVREHPGPFSIAGSPGQLRLRQAPADLHLQRSHTFPELVIISMYLRTAQMVPVNSMSFWATLGQDLRGSP